MGGKKGSKKQKNKPMKGRRKQKKGASKRRRGGNKGQKGGKRSKGRPTARRDPRSSTVAGTCFESAIFYMKLWKDVVGNFEKQRKRMIKQNKTGGNKSGKKGLFAPIGHRLVDIGGGNKANKESSAITSALKACTTAFGKCRKFEDEDEDE